MHTLVIGGGIIGLTQAYHLAREGEQVTLVDARATGLGASEVNAGWVVPAEAAPVPGPGVVLQSMKWMLRPDSPLYIRPSLDPAFAKFMLGMWGKSNRSAQRAGFDGHLRLAQDTVEIFDEYQADGISFEMHSEGLLMAFTQQEILEHHLGNLDLPRSYGLDPQVLLGDDVRNHEPLLADVIRGGIYYPKERHLDPGALCRSLHAKLVQLGVDIVENAPLQSVQHSSGKINSVTAGGRTLRADNYVLATGAWTGELSKLFGLRLPVRPGKGYSVEVDPLPLRGATNLWDAKVAITPFESRLRIAGTMEFGGLDEDINQVRVDAILRAPAKYLRGFTVPEHKVEAKAGMRPMTPDGLPIMGQLPRFQNGYVSTGHGMLGVTLAPASAEALTQLIRTGRRQPKLNIFDPARFARSH